MSGSRTVAEPAACGGNRISSSPVNELRRGLPARLTALIMVIWGVIGCSGQPPVTHYYLLEPPAATMADAGAAGTQIGVRTFRVDPPYDQDRIVYRVGEASAEVGFYEYHRWAAPLHRMLPAVVAAAVGDGAPGVSAEPVVPGGTYDAYLQGRLLTVEEIDLPEGQRVRVRLQLTLRDREGTELWSDRVEGEAILATDSVPRIVDEMRRVLDSALRDAAPAVAAAAERGR